jgi:hypothetical protein
MCTLKQFLNIATTGIEALVISKNKIQYACVKELCHLSSTMLYIAKH